MTKVEDDKAKTRKVKMSKLNPSQRLRRQRMCKWPGCWKGVEMEDGRMLQPKSDCHPQSFDLGIRQDPYGRYFR